MMPCIALCFLFFYFLRHTPCTFLRLICVFNIWLYASIDAEAGAQPPFLKNIGNYSTTGENQGLHNTGTKCFSQDSSQQAFLNSSSNSNSQHTPTAYQKVFLQQGTKNGNYSDNWDGEVTWIFSGMTFMSTHELYR